MVKDLLVSLWATFHRQGQEGLVMLQEEPEHPVDSQEWVAEVEKARREWADARSYFETVTDDGLVDYAVYMIEATERKYMYLLRRAREMGIISEGPYPF